MGSIFKAREIVASIERLDENIDKLSRKDEILNWLDNREGNDDFVIIDDDKSLNSLPNSIKEKCVITSSIIGLDENCALNAMGILRSSQLIST